MLVGLRGVGKTVLLNKVAEIAEESGFIATLVETPENKNLPELLIPCLRKSYFGSTPRKGLQRPLSAG
jgi:hypothetical protein